MTTVFRAQGARRSVPSHALRVIPLLFVALTLGACKHGEAGTQVDGWTLADPSQRHPIMVSQQPSHLNLAVARGSQGLTPSQRAEVLDFAGHFRAGDSGNSRLIISAPSGTANESAAMTAANDVHSLLLDGGFSEASIAIEAYREDAGPQAPVRISYMRYVAEGPTCGNNWDKNLAYNPSNVPHPDLGCATQHNLAAMIANPADLLGPRTETARPAERRDDAMGKYVKGKITGAEKSEEERVRVKGAN